jgi:hypothetical protein
MSSAGNGLAYAIPNTPRPLRSRFVFVAGRFLNASLKSIARAAPTVRCRPLTPTCRLELCVTTQACVNVMKALIVELEVRERLALGQQKLLLQQRMTWLRCAVVGASPA